METITGLVPQKRRSDRVNVHIDGEYAFSLTSIIAARLSVGMEITPSKIEQLKNEDSYESAKQSAINFVSFRPRSIVEVRRNLGRKKFEEKSIDRVVERLIELEMLNDKEFARYWVDQRESFKPRSRRALRYELYQKGVDREIIEESLEDIDEDSSAFKAGFQRAQRWAAVPEEKFRQDMQRFLQRRGFNYSVIFPVIDRLWLTVTENDDQ